MFINRAPQQVGLTAQRDEHLVKMRRAAKLAAGRFHPVSKARAEFVTPAPDRLVRHDHAALEEQFLDVAQAQLETKVPAHRAADDARWETVTVIERFRFLHAILRD